MKNLNNITAEMLTPLEQITKKHRDNGYLFTTPENKHQKLSIKIQESIEFLDKNNIVYDSDIVIPFIVKMFQKNENFDTIYVLKKFLKEYNELDVKGEFLINFIEEQMV